MRFQRESDIENYIVSHSIKFLGQIEMDEEEYEHFFDIASGRLFSLLYRECRPSLPPTDLFISMLLVQYAIRNYEEGRYWPRFKEDLDLDFLGFNTSSQSYIGRVFLRTLRKYKLFILPNSRDDAQEYVENIKAHALVTNYYMDGFFDFAYDYYETNLFRQIDENIYDDIAALSVFMKHSLNSDKDTISSDEGDLKKASKTYRLLKSTRRVFSACEPEQLTAMFLPVLSMIDQFYFNEIMPDAEMGRFEKGFIDWCRKKRYADEADRIYGKHRRLHSNKPYFHVIENNEKAFLVIPPQKFRYEDCRGIVKVTVTSKQRSQTYELFAYKSFGVYLTEEEGIPIDDIFEKYEIAISSEIVKSYTIPACSYRIFNKHWESIPKFRKKPNILLVKHGISVEWQNEEDVIDSYEGYKRWYYFMAEINDNSVCTIGGNPVSLSGEFANHPIFDEIIDSCRIYDIKGKKIVAAKCHPAVSFLIEDYKISGTSVIVNEKKYRLDKIKEKACFDWPVNKAKKAVTLMLRDFLPNQDGRYRIIVDIPGETKKTLCDYLIFNAFSFQFNQPRYIYNKRAVLTIYPGDFRIISRDENCVSYYKDSEKERFRITLTPESQDVSLSILTHLEEYKIVIPLSIFKYGFDMDQMIISKELIWYTDVENILYLYFPNTQSVQVFMNNDRVRYVEGERISDSLYKLDISEFANVIRNDNSAEQYSLCIWAEKMDFSSFMIQLPNIRRKVKVFPYFLMRSRNDTPQYDVRLFGKADLYIDVFDSESKEKLIEHQQIVSGVNELPELNAYDAYDVYPYMEESDDFGFEVVKTNLHALKKTGCVDYDNLLNCVIPITGIVYHESLLRIGTGYSYYVSIKENIGNNTYNGQLILKKKESMPFAKPKTQMFLVCEVRVYCTFYENDMNMYLSQLLPENDELIDLYYNKRKYKLTKHKNYKDQYYNTIDNLKLPEEKTTFRAAKDKIRRM